MDCEGGKEEGAGEWETSREKETRARARETRPVKERQEREEEKKNEKKEAAESSFSYETTRCGFDAGRKEERVGERRVKGGNRGGRIRRGARFSTKPIIRCVTSCGRLDGAKRGNRVSSSSSLCIDVRLSSFVFHATLAGDVGGSRVDTL